MADSEFSIIRRYFSAVDPPPQDIGMGIGDDAALLNPPADTMFGVRRADCAGSRLRDEPSAAAAAMLGEAVTQLRGGGLRPVSFTLSLTLPLADPRWLRAFSSQLADTAARFGVTLIGGDTSRGPWLAVIHCHGFS